MKDNMKYTHQYFKDQTIKIINLHNIMVTINHFAILEILKIVSELNLSQNILMLGILYNT